MKTLLDKNMDFLKDVFPQTFQIIKDHQDSHQNSSDSELRVELEKTKNGLMNIKLNTISGSFFLHSHYDPYREASLLISKANLSEKDTVIILGFGMGYHIEQLIEEYPKLNKIVIEPSRDLFLNAISNRDLRHIFGAKNMNLVLNNDMALAGNYLSQLYLTGKIHAFEFFELPSFARLHSHLFDELKGLCAKFLRAYNVNLRTEMFFFEDWVTNFFRNLSQMAVSADVEDLAGKFNNIPAIMVSAGPSMKKNIDILRQVSNRALIIANGSTVSILQAAGIKPHVMLGIDGNEKMSDILCAVEWDDVLLAYIFSLHHRCVNSYNGPKVYLKCDTEPFVRALELDIGHETRIVQSGGSCANVSLDFLTILGCDPIIMVGQDLAYPDMEVYAEGHFNKAKEANILGDKSQLVKAKDYTGKDIFTSNSFLSMLNTFENYISNHSQNRLFLNATEGGLPIGGVANIPLTEAANLYCNKPIDVKKMLDGEIEKSATQNGELKSRIAEFVKKIEKAADEIAILSEDRLDLVSRILKDLDNGKLNEIGPKNTLLSKNTRKLESNKLFKSIYYPIVHNVFIRIKNHSEGLAKKTTSQREKMIILNQGLKNQFHVVERLNLYTLESAKEFLGKVEQEV